MPCRRSSDSSFRSANFTRICVAGGTVGVAAAAVAIRAAAAQVGRHDSLLGPGLVAVGLWAGRGAGRGRTDVAGGELRAPLFTFPRAPRPDSPPVIAGAVPCPGDVDGIRFRGHRVLWRMVEGGVSLVALPEV